MHEPTAKITSINLNLADNKMQSKNASLSSSCSSSSYSIKTLNQHELEPTDQSSTDTIFVRVSINDQSLQKVMKFKLDEAVFAAKQRVLSTLAKEVKDGLNYGFYLPPYQGRAGKFLDDCRKLREYSLNGPMAHLEFKYKKRVYKFVKINQKELKALNVKANFKKFVDLVRTNQADKIGRFLDKGLDPNFHTDLGETPLSIAVGLAEPKHTIMALYNGGAHLDFRSRDSLTPMHRAAIVGNDKAVKTLLELGAFADVIDHKALTPLYYAVLHSSPIGTVEHLLSNGSLLGVRDHNNWQEIHHACKLGLSHHLDHLIYYGCDLNAKNNSGNTPLHVCAVHNQPNCARILLFRGCAKHERNLSNQSAYESAVMAGNQLVADLILSHKESQTVVIKERPVYNTKRRSIYVSTETQSHYSSISALTANASNTNNTFQNKESTSCSSGSRSRSISSDTGSHNYACVRKPLYPAIPNRTFVCTKAFRAVHAGEIELSKGDVVELLSVGEAGYWEGRHVSSGVHGWFKAECVEELALVKRKSLFDLLMSNSELDAPRTVVLQKGKRGFGFVLRGAKISDEKFEPTLECPAMQFLESVDKESNADRAGLKPFDFVLEINGVDVTCSTHLDCVKLIKKTGDTLALKVYTSKAFSGTASNQIYQTPDTVYAHDSLSKPHSYYATSTIATRNFFQEQSEFYDGSKSLPNKKKPIPPRRDPSTSLSSDVKNASVRVKSINLGNINHKDLMTTAERKLPPRPMTISCKSMSAMVKKNDMSYMNSIFAQIDELDKTLAEYDCTVPDSVLKTKLLADDANAASIRTRVPVRKPGINNADLFKEPLSYHHKTLSVPNLMVNPVSPNMPPPPPPPPPTVPSISHRTHCSKNRSMLALSPAYSDIYSSPNIDQCEPSDQDPVLNNSTDGAEPPVDYDQETNLVMMAPKNATSPLTPRQIKQRNSAKRTSTIQKSDCQFLQSQKFDQEFLQTSKDLFLRYPTAKISISVSDGAHSRQIEIDRQMFDKLYKSQQPQTPIRTTSVLTALNSSLPSSSSPSSVSSASSAYDTAIADTPPVGLNEAIKKAALEHQKRQSDKTTPASIVHKTPNVKNELEKALENRLKRLSVLQAETEHEAPSFPPPPSPGALNKLNEHGPAPERVCSPPPPPPPPLPPLLPPPPPPPQTTTTIESTKPTTLKTTVKNLVNTYQLIDPRSSSDFGELIAKKAAEKRAKFHENKPVLSSVTYQPDGSKVVNAFKPNEDSNVKKTIASLQKANAQLGNNSAQTPSQNNDSESEMNQNQESFITTASKLLEKAKQKQHSIDTNKPDQKPTPVAASAQHSLKIK